MPDINPTEIFNKYDTFLFDWDGTVSDTLPSWTKFIKSTLKAKWQIEVTDKMVIDTIGQWGQPMLLGVPEDQFDIREWQAICDRETIAYIGDSGLFPDVLEVIKKIKTANKKIGIVTTASQIFINGSITHNELENIFDAVVSADDVTAHKPDPEPILHAIELLGADRETTLMLGDSINDILGAKNAGVDSLFFYPASHRHHDNEHILLKGEPMYIINSWRELLS